MGFFDKAKQLFGLGGDKAEEDEDDAPAPGPHGRKDRKDRPPLHDVPASHGRTVEDALAAREGGEKAEARKIFAEIDRGAGLRVVLRAAAALEDGDEDEVRSLLPAVAKEAEGWKLLLQIAGALGDPALAAPYVERATEEKAPAWAIAWARVASKDETERREGLVELLFTDAPLARTVAARDLAVPAVLADAGAAERYAAFAHGRDSIRRFGATIVADLILRARTNPSGAARPGSAARGGGARR